jgi:Family of unknown function (DUF6644)
MMQRLCDWLAATRLSQAFAGADWFVPAVQTVHILAIAAVLTMLVTLHLRMLGLMRNAPPLQRLAVSYLPWIWRGLAVLLVSGVLLTVTEPGRELLNVSFRVKMLLVLALVALTLVLQRGLRRDPQFWDVSPVRRRLGGALALGSLLLCIGIVAAGRLIAYV